MSLPFLGWVSLSIAIYRFPLAHKRDLALAARHPPSGGGFYLHMLPAGGAASWRDMFVAAATTV